MSVLRKNVIFIMMIFLVLPLSGCNRSEKHEKNAEVLENTGRRIEANMELIRALRYAGKAEDKVALQIRIAQNYKQVNQLNEAIEYYRKAIETADKAKIPAPWTDLANCYISKGMLDDSIYLVQQLDKNKPQGFLRQQAEISRLIGAYYEKNKNFTKALVFYENSLGYAQKDGDNKLVQDCRNRLTMLKNRK